MIKYLHYLSISKCFLSAGIDALVVWDPFPLIATHKLFLDVAALRILAAKVNRQRGLFKPELVQCKLPGNFFRFHFTIGKWNSS
jgi:hypothetical protein